MLKIALSAVAMLLTLDLIYVPAQAAGLTRAFVSATGADANDCSFGHPCRTFQHAHDVSAADGEIDVLDPAGYGAVTITKSISIQGHGFSGITMSSGNAITVNAGPTDSVILNGLLINGAGGAIGTSSIGIVFNTGRNLTIDNCLVENFSSFGILIQPSTPTSFFSISNTRSTNVFSNEAIRVRPAQSSLVSGTISRVFARNSNSGIAVESDQMSANGALRVSITDTDASNNSNDGIVAVGAASATAKIIVRNSVMAGNGRSGAGVAANGEIALAHSVSTGNADGVLVISTGTIWSFGDNDIMFNTSDNVASLTPTNQH